MEVVWSEVYLWLSDEWIVASLVEEIDIDTAMLRSDTTQLRMVGTGDMLIQKSDETRKYPRSTEIPTAQYYESLVFRETLYECLELWRDAG